MTLAHGPAPDLLPILSRGRHRTPRKGACFMEMASYLAGERWSDHPTCTHPLLAAVARQVNDLTTDAGRDRLAPMIPSVIGLASDDPRVDAMIALACATTALPVVSEERQRALAVAVLTAERVLARLDGRPAGSLSVAAATALAAVPLAQRWARDFTHGLEPSATEYRRRSALHSVQLSTTGVAAACVQDPDGLLRTLLQRAIDACALVSPAPQPAPLVARGDWAALREQARVGSRA